MSAADQKAFIDQMKARGVDVSAFEQASKANSATAAAFAPKYGEVSAATIDALFAPLPPVQETAGRAWTYTADKQLKSVALRLGLSDGTNTELVGGGLEQGAELVTGILGIGASRPTLGGNNQNQNPLLGNQQRGGPPGGGFGGPPAGGFGGGGGRGR
jgi:hypothetical protein